MCIRDRSGKVIGCKDGCGRFRKSQKPSGTFVCLGNLKITAGNIFLRDSQSAVLHGLQIALAPVLARLGGLRAGYNGNPCLLYTSLASASSADAWAVWPSCHRNSLERKNGRVVFSQRTTEPVSYTHLDVYKRQV